MIKGLGLNAVGVYVFWNHHEIEKGVFDFTKGERDLVGFLELAQKHGLKVLLRPGPYVCAEWDFGGLPARLLEHSSLTIRASNAAYEAEVYTYFKALSEVVKPYLNINGGSIILLQI
jgi:beta-galactosidase GanA